MAEFQHQLRVHKFAFVCLLLACDLPVTSYTSLEIGQIYKSKDGIATFEMLT